MSKVLKIAAIATAIVVTAGYGGFLTGALTGLLGGTFTALSISMTIVGGIALMGAALAFQSAAKALGLVKTPKLNNSIYERLHKQVNPTAYRKICFGETAFGTDVRFNEKYSSDDRYVEVIACASHKTNAIKSIYMDEELVWTSSGGIQGKYASGIVSITAINEGSSGNSFSLGSGGYWTTQCRMTGLSYVAIVYYLDAKKWPEGIPNRITIIGEGCPVYDPRRDSTNGGSGSHRVDDQSTWEYADGSDLIGENPALVLLTYLLGWKINNKPIWGMHIPPLRIDFTNFASYANLCEESVALASGGTIQRYTAGIIFSDGDSRESVISALTSAMGTAKLVDVDGLYRLIGGYDDTADPAISYNEDDLGGVYEWSPSPPSRERFNIARGRFVDPDKLYQLNDWPEVSVAPLADNIPRVRVMDFAAVQRPETCQRIVKQMLMRDFYPGIFTGVFLPRGFLVSVGSLVTISLAQEGWNGKLFRVIHQSESHDLLFQMTLQEENSEIYAWDSEERDLPANLTPPQYDPTETRQPQSLAATSRTVAGASYTTVPYIDITWTPETGGTVSGIELQAKTSTDDNYTTLTEGLFDATTGEFTTVANATGVEIDIRARYRMMSGVYGAWVETSVITEAATVPDITGLEYNIDSQIGLTLSWNKLNYANLDGYEIRIGASWAAGTLVAKAKTNTYKYGVIIGSSQTFWVAAVDIFGTYSDIPQGITTSINTPSAVVLTADVIDNNIMLRWTASTGSFAIGYYELRKGSTWETANVVGVAANATVKNIFETSSGEYTYWIAAVDIAGNYGPPDSVTVVVNQPPDYVLLDEYDSDFSGTLSSASISGNLVIIPVNTTESYEDHFIDNSWSSPQDQITAGYPIYIQPEPASGYYEEEIDTGAVIAGSAVTVTPTIVTVSGSPTVSITIYYKELIGDSWSSVSGPSAFISNYRYLKIRVEVSGGLVQMTSLVTKLDVKIKRDNGVIACNSGDSGGTTVNFNVSFLDIDSITVTALGTTAIIAIYDFVDAPNPTSFKILLFNTSGTRISGTASWSAIGK